MNQTLLEQLHFPDDLKHLSKHDLEVLADDIRQKLIAIGDACGGHLASNLGVVELTIAMHAVLDSPTDKIIWDTSHQCYVHKILTGRLDRMLTIRQFGGLSGFAKITESDHDIFGAGHASTALSAAMGVAHARDILKEDYSVFSVIGDASLSGGMAFEALNNIEKLKTNFVCVLNDNDMSISRPIGSMANYMTRLRTSGVYNQAKINFERILEKIPRIGVPLKRRVEKIVDRFRDMVLDMKFGVIFEEFGFRYLGPIDGHNIPVLMAAFKYAKTYPGPIMVHVITTKGKGHVLAEKDPIKYHGVSPKKPLSSAPPVVAPKTYTQIFGEEMIALATQESRLVVITPAMKEGSGLVEYAQQFPDRFFDVGIAEEHAVTFAAGLARVGVKPVLSIYSTFLQRGFDQVIHDVCLQHLPVIFCLDRAGVVGEDGPTHHGVFDYAFLLPIPDLMILAPKDGPELRAMLAWAVAQNDAVSIRYPKGAAPELSETTLPVELGKSEVLCELKAAGEEGFKRLLIAAGSMVDPTLRVAKQLFEQEHLSVAVINLRFIKPLDTALLKSYCEQSDQVYVIEEGCEIGGVFSHVLGSLPDLYKKRSDFHSISFPDDYLDHGSVDQLRNKYGLSFEKILERVKL